MKTPIWNLLSRKSQGRQAPAERRKQARHPGEVWTPAMRENHLRQAFLEGVEVQDSDLSEWQDTMVDFLRR